MKMLMRKRILGGENGRRLNNDRWITREYDLLFIPSVGTKLDGETIAEIEVETSDTNIPVLTLPRGINGSHTIVLRVNGDHSREFQRTNKGRMDALIGEYVHAGWQEEKATRVKHPGRRK